MRSGDLLDRVGFVKDSDIIVGQNAGPFSSQSQVREKHRVVHDQNVGVPHPSPCPVVQTVVVGRAAFAQAVAMFALDLFPDFGEWAKAEVGQAAIAGLIRPFADLPELRQGLAVEQCARPLHRSVHTAEADVVRPALDEHRRELDGHDRIEERDVLADQLFLKSNGVSTDDDLAAVTIRLAGLSGCEDRGDEVGKALADPGSGLDNQMPLRLDGPGDRVSHRQLLLAAFVACHAIGNQSSIAEDIFRE